MSELVTVYASVPPNGHSSPGCVLYRGVYFSVTLRCLLSSDGQHVEVGTMANAIVMMNNIVDAHEAGLIAIAPACLYRDPADQRPAEERSNRNRYESGNPPADGAKLAPNGKVIKSFECVKIEKERDPKSKKTYIGLYEAGHKWPDVRVREDDKLWSDLCEALHNLTGMDWGGASALGSVWTRESYIVGYTDSDRTTVNGNPYRDYFGIRAK